MTLVVPMFFDECHKKLPLVPLSYKFALDTVWLIVLLSQLVSLDHRNYLSFILLML